MKFEMKLLGVAVLSMAVALVLTSLSQPNKARMSGAVVQPETSCND